MSIAQPTGSLDVKGIMGKELPEEVGPLGCGCSEEGECQRGLSAVYGQNRCLSLCCLSLGEGGLSNREESTRRRPN